MSLHWNRPPPPPLVSHQKLGRKEWGKGEAAGCFFSREIASQISRENYPIVSAPGHTLPPSYFIPQLHNRLFVLRFYSPSSQVAVKVYSSLQRKRWRRLGRNEEGSPSICSICPSSPEGFRPPHSLCPTTSYLPHYIPCLVNLLLYIHVIHKYNQTYQFENFNSVNRVVTNFKISFPWFPNRILFFP